MPRKRIHTTSEALAAANKAKCKRRREKIKLEKIARGEITVKKQKTKGKIGRPVKYETEEDRRKAKRAQDKIYRRKKRQADRLKREVDASREGFEKNLEARYQLCN